MKLYSILTILLATNVVQAQELVPNGDFEDYTECPIATGQIEKAFPWQTFGQSPDYYNACAAPYGLNVPENIVSYQESYSGNAYVGTFQRLVEYPELKEFIGVKLIAPLEIGNTYYIDYQANMALNLGGNYSVACSHIGGKFTNTVYSLYSPPALDNAPHFYDTTTILEEMGWVTVSGTFVADSAYEYLMIGNFFEDGMYNVYSYEESGEDSLDRSYYYIEDVSVQKIGNNGIESSESNFHVNYDFNTKRLTIEIINDYLKLEYIQIYTISGTLVENILVNSSSPTTQVDLNALNHGTYIVRLTDKAAQTIVRKIVI
ncbi:MAG: hypothetical protein ACI8ZM_000436 [Crocinitomix sp.]|jgi:hypothetical protein